MMAASRPDLLDEHGGAVQGSSSSLLSLPASEANEHSSPDRRSLGDAASSTSETAPLRLGRRQRRKLQHEAGWQQVYAGPATAVSVPGVPCGPVYTHTSICESWAISAAWHAKHTTALTSWATIIGTAMLDSQAQVLRISIDSLCVRPGLLPFTEHAFRVRACSSAGCSDWSASVVLSTDTHVPSCPRANAAEGMLHMTSMDGFTSQHSSSCCAAR